MRDQNDLLVAELSRLLDPSSEFTRLAVANLETRAMTAAVVEGWKPAVAAALGEWVRRQALANDLGEGEGAPATQPVAHEVLTPAQGQAETFEEDLDGFAMIQQALGAERPVACRGSASCLEVHLPERHRGVVCLLLLRRLSNLLVVPLPPESAAALAGGRAVAAYEVGWSAVYISSTADLADLGELLQVAWEIRRRERPVAPQPRVGGAPELTPT
jgi:hypothetical protein